MRPIRHGDRRQIFTSVADTTLTLAPPMKQHFLVVGTAVLYWIVLPDARYFKVGDYLVFENASSEFVGIRNSNSTVWHRLPPRAELHATLVTNATAAGTWSTRVIDPALCNPAYGMCETDDFLSYTSNTRGVVGVVSGAGAIVSPSFTTIADSAPGRQGNLMAITGTTAAGYALAYVAAGLNYLSGGCRAFEVAQNLGNISTAVEEYLARFGLGSNVTGGAHTEGAYFLYDRAGTGVNWQFRTVWTVGGGGSTTTDTGIAPVFDTTSGTFQKLRVEIASTGVRADAWIGTTQVTAAGGQGNLPLSTAAVRIGHIGMTKTVGVTSRYSRTDYMCVQSYPLTLR